MTTEKVPQRSGGEVSVLRIRVAAAESKMKAAKAESREAKRRRKEARRAAQSARKRYKQAKTELAELREELARAEAKLLQPKGRAPARKARPSKPSARTRRRAVKTPGADRSRSQPARRRAAFPPLRRSLAQERRIQSARAGSVRKPKRSHPVRGRDQFHQPLNPARPKHPSSPEQAGFESGTPLSHNPTAAPAEDQVAQFRIKPALT